MTYLVILFVFLIFFLSLFCCIHVFLITIFVWMHTMLGLVVMKGKSWQWIILPTCSIKSSIEMWLFSEVNSILSVKNDDFGALSRSNTVVATHFDTQKILWLLKRFRHFYDLLCFIVSKIILIFQILVWIFLVF